MINVTKPYLPSKSKYEKYVNGIWKRGWLTNNGPLLRDLESQLKQMLQVKHLLLTSNGTVALQIAIRALGLKGEVITTPFSYVATTSSIVWEHCTPVMVDICPRTLMIDPHKIEEAITPATTGILATHVFGGMCEVELIEEIASKNNLRVIYDAAHCFGTTLNGRSAFGFGDIATTSFHATKLFHTIEGGAVITDSDELFDRLVQLRNFGHITATEFGGLGINAKNSEFHAAMGLSILDDVPAIIEERKQISHRYDRNFLGSALSSPVIREGCNVNYAYYPVILPSEHHLLHIVFELNKSNVFPRRYFYPSLDNLSYVERKGFVPLSNDVASRILCLPLYNGLSKEEVDMIAAIVIAALGSFASA